MTDQNFDVRVHVTRQPAEVSGTLTDPAALRVRFAEHAEVSLLGTTFRFWGRYTPQGAQRLLEVVPDRLLRLGWTLEGREREVEIALEPEECGTC